MCEMSCAEIDKLLETSIDLSESELGTTSVCELSENLK